MNEEARHRAFVLADPPATQVRRVLDELNLGEATRITRLTGGLETATHRVDTATRSIVLRRFDQEQPWHTSRRVAHEARMLISLSTLSVPVPEVLWVDEAGHSGCPILVLSLLPGRVMSPPLTDVATLGRLAEAMGAVHAGPVPDWRNEWRDSWCAATPDPLLQMVPGFDRLWECIEETRDELMSESRVLAHHDLHPGNTLWLDGAVTGVLDWGGAAAGFGSFDAAYCAKDLSLSLGDEAGERFLDAWARQSGAPLHPGWRIVAAYGMLGDLMELPAAYAELGMPVSHDLVQQRFDAWVGAARAELGLSA